jgi:hypothetical protein
MSCVGVLTLRKCLEECLEGAFSEAPGRYLLEKCQKYANRVMRRGVCCAYSYTRV